MRFNAKDFDILPPSIVRWIIAHELAHVFQKALGKPPGGESKAENEDDADGIATGWGFDSLPRRTLNEFQINGKMSLEAACELLVRCGLG